MRPPHRHGITTLAGLALTIAVASSPIAPPAGAASSDAVAIPAGTFDTILVIDEPTVAIASFALARTPVTNAAFLAFTEANPPWRRSHAPAVFAPAGYLRHWADDTALGDARSAAPDVPVTNVTWYAAMSYWDWVGGRLPTEFEWEYVAGERIRGDDARAIERFAWSSNPGASLRPVGQAAANPFEIYDLHTQVLEWVEDFETVLPGTDDGSPFGIAHGAHHTPLPLANVATDSLYHLSATWTDQHGHALRLADFHGQPVMITMFYGTCTTACPLLLHRARTLQTDLGVPMPVLAVSFDPETDTPAAMRDDAAQRGYADGTLGAWSFLSGTPTPSAPSRRCWACSTSVAPTATSTTAT